MKKNMLPINSFSLVNNHMSSYNNNTQTYGLQTNGQELTIWQIYTLDNLANRKGINTVCIR